MAGSTLPAMSNSGSGNQGITVSMPIIAYAMKYDVADEPLARALILSNLVAIHIKHFLGKLSALRGTCIPSTDGIVEDDVEATIRNVGAIGSAGMKATDSMILDIMLCK